MSAGRQTDGQKVKLQASQLRDPPLFSSNVPLHVLLQKICLLGLVHVVLLVLLVSLVLLLLVHVVLLVPLVLLAPLLLLVLVVPVAPLVFEPSACLTGCEEKGAGPHGRKHP